MRPSCRQKIQSDRNASPVEGETEDKPEGQLEIETDDAQSGLSSCCPSCGRPYDVALFLPCSHTLCGRCVVSGEDTQSCCFFQGTHGGSTSSRQSICAVLCPCCRHQVELPCWEWASALRCLPHHPILSPQYTSLGTGTVEGASESTLGVLQGNTPLTNVPGTTERDCLHGRSPTTPVDGAIDLLEEEMVHSVQGLSFALDPSSISPSLLLSNSCLTITYNGQSLPVLLSNLRGNKISVSTEACDLPAASPLPWANADVIIRRGQYYWEVDVCNSTLYKIGVRSLDGSSAWLLERHGASFWAVYDGRQEILRSIPPHIKTLGLFLNIGGGVLSFHNSVTQEHLVTLPTRFSPDGVLPALGLGQGRLRLRCGLPPPPHVFLSRVSAYRGPRGASRTRWRRDVRFQSVRTAIQKFEELGMPE